MIVTIDPPESEPVTVAEALAHCRLDAANLEPGYEAAMGVWIAAARGMAEQELRRYLVTQALEYRADRFPGYFIRRIGSNARESACPEEIRIPPAQRVESITYLDANGAEQTLDPGRYAADTASEPARITPIGTWPSTTDRPNAVKVRFVAGYGEAADVPACVKAWILLKVAEMHPSVKQPMPEYAGGLLDPERVFWRIQ